MLRDRRDVILQKEETRENISRESPPHDATEHGIQQHEVEARVNFERAPNPESL
jgi:hypothetical protein